MININFQVRAENFQPATREYIEERLNRLSKYLSKYESLVVKIDPVSKSRVKQFLVEINLTMPNAYIKVEDQGKTINTVFDSLLEPLQKKLTRYHSQEERWSKHKEWKSMNYEAAQPYTEDDAHLWPVADFTPVIKRKKYKDDKPLHPAEAVEKMELLGDNSYFFKNIEDNRYALLKKRADGTYTLLQPEQ